ncbi:DUF1294 domain-containing protein [Flavobacterium sp. GB2R13]|uniref:DUF1294 domain-containing protein n=1 Tax=Flavobacterium algoris TaxID=3398733 RepID=UPI003A8C5992
MTLLYSFLTLNILAFIITAYDKRLAITHKKRISEETLLTFAAVGGTIGSALAMYIFRHKIAKKHYLFKFFRIVFIQILIIGVLFYFDIFNENYIIKSK